MQNFPKVLLVEDDRSITDALAQAFQNSHHMAPTKTGELALYKADADHYDIIVLDLGLPDMSGLSVCQQLAREVWRRPFWC